MKNLLLICILFVLGIRSFSQNFSKTILTCSGTFTYTALIQEDKSKKITITDINDATRKVEFIYFGDDASDFKTLFQTQFLKLKPITCSITEQSSLLNEGNEIWSKLRILAIQSLPQSYSNSIAAGDATYTYTGSFNSDNSIKVTIEDMSDASKKVEYTYNGADVTAFMAIFQRKFLTVPSISVSEAEKEMLLKEGNNLWMRLVSIRPLPTASFAPIAGELSIAKKISYYIPYIDVKSKKEIVYRSSEYDVQDVHIEFNNGYIENIYFTLLIQGKPRTYINIYGIGFTSIENQNKLDSLRLFQKGAPAFKNKKAITLEDAQKSNNFTFIKLGELLKYKPQLEVDRRDYSPKDASITLYGGQNITLYKEETNKLFEAHIFSDFVGLQEDKPNGLVQTEVEKRININSTQWQTWRFIYPIFKSFGIFQFITPTITISKLEQHNKRLLLGDMDSLRLNPGNNDISKLDKNAHRYVTALDLYQRQSFSAGCDLNVLFFSNHNLKYNLYFNIGGRLGITPVTDSITSKDQNSIKRTGVINDYSINTLQIIPEARLIFLPEERLNFSLAYKAIFIKPFLNDVQLLAFDKNDLTKFNVKNNQWLNTLELLMTFNVNKTGDGKLFGRLRFNSEINNYKNNFAQIQIGYSAYILGSNK